jgi:hypothetical protein
MLAWFNVVGIELVEVDNGVSLVRIYVTYTEY